MSWGQVLDEFDAALDAMERAGVDDLDAAAEALAIIGAPGLGPVPAALQPRAFQAHARLNALITDFEARRAGVGSELAAIAAAAASAGAGRPVPKFLDTRA